MSLLQENRLSSGEAPTKVGIFTSKTDPKSSFSLPADPRVSESIGGVPRSFLEEYARIALRHAYVEAIKGGRWFAEVKGLRGAWGDGESRDQALDELQDAIISWVALKLEAGIEVPPVAGFDLNPGPRREQAS